MTDTRDWTTDKAFNIHARPDPIKRMDIIATLRARVVVLEQRVNIATGNCETYRCMADRLRAERDGAVEVVRIWAAADSEIEEAVRQTVRSVAREKRDAFLAKHAPSGDKP